MDLITIVRKFWRYRLVTVPVIVLTLCGALYVVVLQKPVYQAQASFALLNPPAPPTAEDVARDPSLGRLQTDNPYTRFGDQSVIVQVLASTLSGNQVREKLLRAGVDRRYTVAPSAEFGYSSPIIQVSAIGVTPEAATDSARRVSTAVVEQLDRLQAKEGTNKRYRIKALLVDPPNRAQLQASGTLRMLVGVLVMGAIVLFIMVSLLDAINTLATERRAPHALAELDVPLDDELWLGDDDRLDERRRARQATASAHGGRSPDGEAA